MSCLKLKSLIPVFWLILVSDEWLIIINYYCFWIHQPFINSCDYSKIAFSCLYDLLIQILILLLFNLYLFSVLSQLSVINIKALISFKFNINFHYCSRNVNNRIIYFVKSVSVLHACMPSKKNYIYLCTLVYF